MYKFVTFKIYIFIIEHIFFLLKTGYMCIKEHFIFHINTS